MVPFLRAYCRVYGVDTEEMARLFESHFATDYPEHGFSVLGSKIEKVYYRIEKHCGVLHRVHLRDMHGDERKHWFFVRHFNPRDSERRFEKGARKAGPAVSFWKPVTHWPEYGMVIWAFPHDPRLAHLPSPVAVEVLGKRNFASLLPLRIPEVAQGGADLDPPPLIARLHVLRVAVLDLEGNGQRDRLTTRDGRAVR